MSFKSTRNGTVNSFTWKLTKISRHLFAFLLDNCSNPIKLRSNFTTKLKNKNHLQKTLTMIKSLANTSKAETKRHPKPMRSAELKKSLRRREQRA